MLFYTFLLSANAIELVNRHAGRRLSYTQILAYNPGSTVNDQANIDLDQKAMAAELAVFDFDAADLIYRNGAHSSPSAVCTIVGAESSVSVDSSSSSSPSVSSSPLGQNVPEGTSVLFTSNVGVLSRGKAISDHAPGSTSITFRYPVSGTRVQPESIQCYVGGLERSKWKTTGAPPCRPPTQPTGNRPELYRPATRHRTRASLNKRPLLCRLRPGLHLHAAQSL